MITLPIDEMLLDLRAKLELFEREGSYAVLDEVYRETRRIDCACEDAIEATAPALPPINWCRVNRAEALDSQYHCGDPYCGDCQKVPNA